MTLAQLRGEVRVAEQVLALPHLAPELYRRWRAELARRQAALDACTSAQPDPFPPALRQI